MEGLNKNINKFGGISHGGLSLANTYLPHTIIVANAYLTNRNSKYLPNPHNNSSKYLSKSHNSISKGFLKGSKKYKYLV